MVEGLIFRWVLDVAPLWPSSSEPGKRHFTKQDWAQEQTSQAALKYLSATEQAKVLRFYFASDAKLCLGSCLLKRKAVSDVCFIPWSDVVIGQDSNKKPCFHAEQASGRTLEFNVSHHGSLVALVGCPEKSIKLGVDIVKIDVDKDSREVMEKGFSDWASTYESVFSDREMQDIVHFMDMPVPSQQVSQDIVRAKLRNFYAHWCLREAFVKMTGEALLASWLKELELRNVQAPDPAAPIGDTKETSWGQVYRGVEAWLHGKQLTEVSLEIQAYRDNYMIATSASVSSANFASFKELDYERDVLPREKF